MNTLINHQDLPVENSGCKRRDFIKKGLIIGTLAGFAGTMLSSSCKEKGDEDEKVTPSEDLMREHGALRRILLIYDNCRQHLSENGQFDLSVLNSSALVIRNFIEAYHEKLEENYLFPRFDKANQLTDLVEILRSQHNAGRTITDQIIQFSQLKSLDQDESQKLRILLGDFNQMYRPHAAREDTILFPAIKKIVSENEYFSLGEEFEKKEHDLFGEDGFESMVEKVAGLEKQMGIYDLSQFTPKM